MAAAAPDLTFVFPGDQLGLASTFGACGGGGLDIASTSSSTASGGRDAATDDSAGSGSKLVLTAESTDPPAGLVREGADRLIWEYDLPSSAGAAGGCRDPAEGVGASGGNKDS